MSSTSPAVRDIYRLTPLQRGMLFHTLLQSEAGDYTTQLALRLRGPLDAQAFRAAWRFLVARHAALRTAFVWEGVQEPVQVVLEEAEPSFVLEDWSALAPPEREPRLAALLESDRATPFDLRQPPLMRVRLARLEPELWQLVWSSHHLLFDGWSLPILWAELWRAYEAARAGRLERHAGDLSPAPPWRDYVAWLAERDREAARGFWREALAGLGEPAALPFLRPAPEAGSPAGPGSPAAGRAPAARAWRDVERTLTPAATAALERGARAAGATLSTLVGAAWALVVGRLCGTREVVVGAVRSGRPPELADVEAMVGMFVNTVPARFTLDEDAEVAPWLARAQRASVALREHEWFPLSEVHEVLGRSSAAPLFESLVVFENYPLVPRDEDEATHEARPRATEGITLEDVRDLERTNVPLNVIVTPGAGLHLRLSFDARRVPEALAPELLESLAQALAELAAGAVTPGRRLGALGALSSAQAQRLARWGDGGPALRPSRSVRDLFDEWVARTPAAIACEDERERLDFATLDARARAFAGVLAARLADAARDGGPACSARPVAVALAPSCELLVGLLAAARLGRPWLLVDPELPPERLRALLAEAAPALVVGDERLGRLAAPGTPCLAPRGPWADEPATSTVDPPEPGPEDLAYVVLTSGSTGRPKAVEVPQRALANLVAATARAADLGPGRRVAQLTATSFDVATLEILAGLLSGATVCFVPPAERVPGAPLTEALARLAVDTLFLSPAVLRELDPGALPALGTLFVGGESLTAELAARWSDRRLIHAYGPAEATVTATQHVLARAEGADDAPPPIGRPLPGVQAWVVDAELCPVPPGGIGELVLGGIGVARGYRGLPRESARRFVPDPFGGGSGARLYRTGDRVRWRPDGQGGASLCFVGRDDDQVKVRGVRVELGEVEAAALAHPDVQQAACACVAGGEGGEGKGGGELVLWFAARPEARLEPARLRRFLAQRLPLALVPGRIEARAALPLTAGGKLDRAALAAALPALDARAHEPPRTALERALAAGFAAVLGRAEIGRDDDFFALGGQSLRALQLVARLRETLGSELTLRTLYEHPSVAALARALEGGDGSPAAPATADVQPPLPPLVARRRAASGAEERLPTSLAQRRLWFLERFEPGSARYVVPVGLRLRGALDVAALEHALDALLARHEVLRTSFGAEGAEPFQRPEPHVPLVLEHVAPAPGEDLDALLGRLARRPFDLERAPLVRATLVRVPATQGAGAGQEDRGPAEDHALLLAFHHIAADGWSLGILVDELARLYAARRAGTAADLPPLPLQYADFALWQASPAVAARRERDVAHWVAALSPPPPPLALPERKLRPPQETHEGHTAGLSLSPALRARVEALARELGTTPFAVVFAAFSAWLGKLSGRPSTSDFLVGTPVAGRERRELEGLVGLFVNTLPLRAELGGDPPFRTLVARAHERVLELHAHAQAPFERLVEELVPERDLARPPLVQVLFAFQNLSLELPRLEGVAVEPLELDTETAKFDLSAFVDEPPAGDGSPTAGWRLALEGNTALFTPETIALWLRSFAHVLERLAADPALRPSQLTLADADEERLLLGWGRASATHPRGETIPSRFARAVAAWPDAPAVVFDGKSLTYAELDRAANRLAWRLLALGLAPEERVAIALERSLELVVAIVAVLKAGGAYVPLDPLYPAGRRRRMLADARARVLLTQRSLLDEHGGEGGAQLALCLDEPDVAAELAAEPEHDPTVRVRPDQLAYLMYTSGSTGTPKGVGVEHRAIVRLLCGEPFLELGPEEVVLQFVSSAFDVAVWELWAALFHGARLEVYRPQKPSLAELGAFVRERGVTTMWLTTGLFHQMVDERPQDLAGVRQLMAGGEALSPAHVRRALERLPHTRLVNGYGPTEASCFTTTHAFAPDDDLEDVLAVPIGRPTGGLRVYVLDDALRLLPRGAWGELWAAGDGLARGYLNDARLTAERFVPDPFADEPGTRMYRIGDRARWLADGTLEYGGRVDRQVKVRGFRLELGEVEAALDEHPAVKKSVVELRGAGEAKHLVAWVVPVDAPPGGPTPDELRAFLRARLPEPMLPARFASLAELPLTPNGKLDRRALPEPGQTAGSERARAPEGALEELMAAIWRDVLALERAPARQDDFFALGGHSLLATQLVVRVRETFGVELSLQTVFRHPRLAELATAVARARRTPGEDDGERDGAGSACAAPQADPGPRHEPERGDAPLSFAQERLWFLERFQPGGGGGHTPFGVDLEGPLAPADVARIERALQVVMERHAALRTSFPEVDGRPVQRVAPPAAAAAFALERVDLSAEPDRERREQALAVLQRRVVHDAFDLERGPLWRAALARLTPERHVLFLCLHHLVCDGWSMALFARDLGAAHDALARGEEPERAEPLPTYADFARWQRVHIDTARRERWRAAWRPELSGTTERLGLGRSPRRAPGAPRRSAGLSLDLERALTERVEALARELGATPFLLYLAALQAVLGRASGCDDFVIGTPVAGRGRRELEELVGMFVNLLPLRARLADDPPFRTLVERARESALLAHEHQELPVEDLVELLRRERREQVTEQRGSELFDVLFTLHNTPPAALRLSGLMTRRRGVVIDGAFATLWLSLEPPEPDAGERRDGGDGVGLQAYFHWDADVLDRSAGEELARAWKRALEAFCRDPELRPGTLVLAGDEEARDARRRLRAPARHPLGATIDGLLAQVARERGAATALAWEGGAWSYAELERRANRLARHLRGLGVGPETRVGVTLPRSPELVLALVAVLRAGGAYVPLAPELSEERRAAQLAAAGVSIVLTTEALADELPVGTLWPVALDAEAAAIEAESDAPLEPPPGDGAGRLAYVLFTSGTTGQPKAVGVEHGSVVRLVRGAPFVRLGPEEVLLQFAPVAFDASTFEIWGALLNGARLELFPDGPASLEALGRFVRERGVTTLWLTATLFHQMVAERAADLRGVRQLLAGGEALSPQAVERALEALPHTQLVNGYGPTECTTFVATHAVERGEDLGDGVPLGTPIDATGLYVLDARMRPVPRGLWGELYVSGRGLARGYLNDPRATAERFVPDPWGHERGESGARLYRTGDRARVDDRGRLVFGGRLDRQLKLRGFRVEPGEIEAALCADPRVEAAVVEARGEGDARHLVAWFVPRGAAPAPFPLAELRQRLARSLPAALVPARFVALEALPRTANGKLDRRALTEPDEEGPRPEARAGHAAVGPELELLTELAADVLGLPTVAPEDDFFELGGHSLLATRLVSRVRDAFGVELPLHVVFEHPRLDALARALLARRADAPAALAPVRPVPRSGAEAPADHPLSFTQERLWLVERLAPGAATYHVPFALELQGKLDAEALARAFDALRERHEALRTRLVLRGDEPRQVVVAPEELEPTRLPAVDLAALAPRERERRLEALGRSLAREPFDLEQGAPVRLCLARTEAERHVLFLVLHHLVCDAWSLSVLAEELAEAYRAARAGELPALPALPFQVADVARWQRRTLAGPALEPDLAWWREHLEGATERLALSDRVRRGHGADGTAGERPARLWFARIEPALAGAARRLARAEGASLYLTLLAVYQVLLAERSGRRSFVVGTPVAGRGQSGMEGLIGFFVETLALRAELPSATRASFREHLRGVRARTLEAFARQHVPFARVVEAVGAGRADDEQALVQTFFTLQNAPRALLALEGLSIRSRPLPTGAAHAELTLVLEEDGEGGLAVTWEADAELFEERELERLQARFEALLAAFVDDPELPARGALPGPTGLAAAASRPPRHGLWRAFLATCTPDAAPAVREYGREYGRENGHELGREALRDAAEALARRLVASGVRPGERVGLLVRGARDLAIGALGILRARAAYVPLDPETPPARVAEILAAAEARVCVARGADAALLQGPALRRIAPTPETDAPSAGDPAGDGAGDGTGGLPDLSRVSADEAAYVVFTSGSSGVPKGVVAPQRGVERLVLDAAYLPLGPGARLARAANPGFDALTFELWGALLCGGTLVELGRERVLSASRLRATLAAERVTHLFLTTALFEELVRQDPAAFGDLDTLLFGGERHAPESVRRLFATGRAPRRLLHVYGPTEATTFASFQELAPEDCGTAACEPLQLPIGDAIDATELWVLDEGLRPVPDGAPGELFIGGEGLAWGYLGRPAASAASFVPHPFAPSPGARLYRTGDLVRRDAAGRLVFLGRRDAQLKLRGFRVEPGEVEAALLAHPAVRAACADARPGPDGDARLVAWVVADSETLDERALLAHVARRLPRAMVPTALVRVDALPLNPNGKVDRRALPEPRWDAARAPQAETRPRPARDPLLELTCVVVADVLGGASAAPADAADAADAIDVRASFFELGGHSLSATRVVARLSQALGREVPLRALFDAPSLEAFAAGLRSPAGTTALPAPVAAPPSDQPREGPLSFAQERLWFLERLQPGTALYHVPLALRLRGPLERDVWRAAFAHLVRRHEALRTRLVGEGATARQIVDAPASPEAAQPLLAEHDLCGLSPEAAEAALAAALADLARQPFDLAERPGWRASLFALAPDEHVLALVVHHALCDGWSLGVLLRELGALITALAAGDAGEVEALVRAPLAQPIDHARWQRALLAGEAGRAQLEWWRAALEGVPERLALPTDRPRPRVQSLRGATLAFELPPALVRDLQRFAREQAATPFVTLHAALVAVLARWSGMHDLCVGTPLAGRSQAALEGTFGFLVDTLVLRTRVDGRIGFRELVRRSRRGVLDAFEHRDVPFERLVEALQLGRDPGRNPLFQVMLAFQDDLLGALALPGLAVEPLALSTATAKFDLTVALAHRAEPGDGSPGPSLAGEIEYDAALFDAATVERLARHLATFLRRALASPDLPLERIALGDEDEERRVATLSRGPRRPAPEPFVPVHERVVRQARRTPAAPAVVDEDGRWSYAELERASAALARTLSARGLRPEEVVGCCARRSRALVAAALGILRAGGVHLALDVDHPPARLAAMLADAGARFVLADADGAAALAGCAVQVLALDAAPAAADAPAAVPAHSPSAPVTPARLAYVVFTSGSTGRPKGVAVPHGGLANLVDWHVGAYGLGAGVRTTLLAGTSFDASVWELWPGLVAGAALHVVPEAVRGDPPRLCAWLAEQAVDSCFLPTPLAEALLAQPGARTLGLGTLLTGGDRLRVRPEPELSFALVNHYGPSEASVVATAGTVAARDAEPVAQDTLPAIGRPIDGVVVRVLEPSLAPAPPGIAGELCVGGAGLARGYLGNPRLTAERFVPDPLAEEPGARLYRSGDRAAWSAAGELVFLGRLDEQVQVRGVRVEPGEVEGVLLSLPELAEAAVLALAPPADDSTGGSPRLCAWVVARDAQRLEPTELRERLRALLPEALVPAEWVQLASLPKNASGKIDRARLPRPEHAPELGAARGWSPPRGATEQRLAAIWSAVLGRERIARDAGFFDLGGHSLALLEVQARLARECGRDVPVVELFGRPTIAELARWLDATAPASATTEASASGAAEATEPVRELHPEPGRGRGSERGRERRRRRSARKEGGS